MTGGVCKSFFKFTHFLVVKLISNGMIDIRNQVSKNVCREPDGREFLIFLRTAADRIR
jgi:hypothetical protein